MLCICNRDVNPPDLTKIPKVAVLMPAYNAELFLSEAVESILSQTFRDFEFIIIDDCSTDGTREATLAWGQKDTRIRVILNDVNLGLAASVNRGVALARADWIARMDADDISLPRRLEKQYAAALANPEAGFITSLLESVDSTGRVVAKARKGVCLEQELLPWFLLFYNRIGGHGQVMARRKTLGVVGGYDELNRSSQDRDLWPRLLRHGPCVVLPEILYQWRADNPNSITHGRNFRYTETSLQVDRREIAMNCGVQVARDEAVALRDFWLRFHGFGQDWDAVQRRLLELAVRFTPPRTVKNPQTRLRGAIAYGWLSNAFRAARMRDGVLLRGHLRRAREAAGLGLPAVCVRFIRDLAAVGGNADRLT